MFSLMVRYFGWLSKCSSNLIIAPSGADLVLTASIDSKVINLSEVASASRGRKWIRTAVGCDGAIQSDLLPVASVIIQGCGGYYQWNNHGA